MDQRTEFALRAMTCENFRALSREYSISAKTGYKWRKRFVERGVGGLAERSRRPRCHARQLCEELVCEMVRLKSAHRHWGPRKIRALYARLHLGADVPSDSSYKRVLERAGLTEPRRRRRVGGGAGRLCSGREAGAPNEVWTVDFKGWWKDAAGLRVEPLTVRDEHSRMLLELRALENSRTESVRARFQNLFERHGLPAAIRSDNGSPFACTRALLGLSRLSAWWLALGIDLERGRPGCPQDNGGHERMHLDVRRELQAGRVGRSQEAFDLWREEFNTERPHEALGMATPAEIYRPSERPFEGTPDELDYGAMDTRRVHRKQGTILHRGVPIMLTSALGGWTVGLAPLRDDERVEVWFSGLLLGHLEPATASFEPADGKQEGGGAPGASADTATLRRPKRREPVAEPNQKCNP